MRDRAVTQWLGRELDIDTVGRLEPVMQCVEGIAAGDFQGEMMQADDVLAVEGGRGTRIAGLL
jgi:hypothetical protein